MHNSNLMEESGVRVPEENMLVIVHNEFAHKH